MTQSLQSCIWGGMGVNWLDTVTPVSFIGGGGGGWVGMGLEWLDTVTSVVYLGGMGLTGLTVTAVVYLGGMR